MNGLSAGASDDPVPKGIDLTTVVAVMIGLVVVALAAAGEVSLPSGSSTSVTTRVTTVATSSVPAGTDGDTAGDSADDPPADEGEAGDGTTVGLVDAPTTSTTEARPLAELSEADVAEALAVSGFPDLDVTIDGSTVTLGGSVPDDVSRRAVLGQVAAVPGVEAVIDELSVG